MSDTNDELAEVRQILDNLERARHSEEQAQDAERSVRVSGERRASLAVQDPLYSLAATGVSVNWDELTKLLQSSAYAIRRDAYRILEAGLKAYAWNRSAAEGLSATMPDETKGVLVQNLLNANAVEAYDLFTWMRQLIPIESQPMGLVLAALQAGEFEERDLTASAICYEAARTQFGFDFILTAFEKGDNRFPRTRAAMEDALVRGIAFGGPLLRQYIGRLSCLESGVIRKALS